MYLQRQKEENGYIVVTYSKMYLQDHDKYQYYAVDIETESLTPNIIHCAVIMNLQTEEVHEFRPPDIERGALADFINTKSKESTTKWVGHNAISFDIPVLNALCGTDVHIDDIVDTLTLSYLYHPHMRNGHSLDAWGQRFSFPKLDFNDFEMFSEEMLTYCRQDVALTARLFRALTHRMREQGFSELSCEIEHKIRVVLDEQERNGVLLDEKKATLMLADFQDKLADLQGRIHEVFPDELTVHGEYKYRLKKDGTETANFLRHKSLFPKLVFNKSKTSYRTYQYTSFNIGSPKQRVKRLLALGWKPTEFTPKTSKGGGGNPKVTEDQLVEFAKVSKIPEVELIRDWMLYNTRIKSLTEWLGHLQEDGRIHGRVLTCGAGTRRMRHMKPNTANICGVDKPYGEEMRELLCVEDRLRMVGIDAKGIEGRVMLHYLNNSAATKVFMEGDIHQMNADAVTEAVGFEVTRRTAKTLYYAFLYGASDGKLGSILGHNRKIGKLVRAAIMKNVPGLEKLVESIEDEFNKSAIGAIKCIDGGFVRCPSPHSAMNYKFQSAGAIEMKLASILAHGFKINSLGGAYLETPMDLDRAKKVLDVHDETQWACDPDYTQTCGEIYCAAITLAGQLLDFNIEMEGDFNVGKNWKETH